MGYCIQAPHRQAVDLIGHLGAKVFGKFLGDGGHNNPLTPH